MIGMLIAGVGAVIVLTILLESPDAVLNDMAHAICPWL